MNFGSAAFFALGAYSTVFFYKFNPLPIPVLIVIAAVVSGIVGFGMGYLTLRLRGAFFAIATLAMAVVLQTLVVNWSYVGGSRGAYIVRTDTVDIGGYTIEYIEYLFLLMMALRFSRSSSRARSRARSSVSVLPPSATTNWRRKRPACRLCGSN